MGSIPESEKYPGVENGNPLQYSCLENPMDRGAWWAPVHGVTKESGMTEQLSIQHRHITSDSYKNPSDLQGYLNQDTEKY